MASVQKSRIDRSGADPSRGNKWGFSALDWASWPENAAEILGTSEVGGALVGGASLTADSFMGIALAAGESDEG